MAARPTRLFFTKSKSNAAISNVCKPAAKRWQKRYAAAHAEYEKQKKLYDHAKSMGDSTFIANAETDMKAAKVELDALSVFKTDLVSFTRYYEFMSQIVDYESTDLEKLSLFARHLAPLLRETRPDEDPLDLSSVELSHYRLSKIRQQDLMMVKEGETAPSGSGCCPCPSGFGPSCTRHPRWPVPCSPSSCGRSGPRFVTQARARQPRFATRSSEPFPSRSVSGCGSPGPHGAVPRPALLRPARAPVAVSVVIASWC